MQSGSQIISVKKKDFKRIIISCFLTSVIFTPLFFPFKKNYSKTNKSIVISLNIIEQKTKNKKSEKKINKAEQLPDSEKSINKIQSDEKTPKKNVLSELNADINSKEKTESDSELNKNIIFQNENNSQKCMEKIQREIERKKKYPEIAKKRNMSGTVSLHLITDCHLNLLECSLVKSSGYRILDNAALELVKSIFPLDGFEDAEYSSVNDDINIEYRLK